MLSQSLQVLLDGQAQVAALNDLNANMSKCANVISKPHHINLFEAGSMWFRLQCKQLGSDSETRPLIDAWGASNNLLEL